MIYLGPGGAQLALDFVGLGLLATAVALGIAAAIFLPRQRWAVAATSFALALGVSGVLAQRSIMAPAEAWPIILSAYDEANGSARLQREQELRETWVLGQIRVTDWLELSKRWHVCHGMWQQRDCRMPVGPHEAQGVAREILETLAQGGPRYGVPLPGSEWTGY